MSARIDADLSQDLASDNQVARCTPRARGANGKSTTYQQGAILDAEENREAEFKSLVNCMPRELLRWKIMQKAKKIICAYLNGAREGVIYFGVEDDGKIVGLDVENEKDNIQKAFQKVLDGHVISDLTGRLQKGGDQNCISIFFVPVAKQGTSNSNLYVIEIEVKRDWTFCEDKIYYSKLWKPIPLGDSCGGNKKKLKDFYEVKEEMEDVVIRTNGESCMVKPWNVRKDVLQPLQSKFNQWRKRKQEANSAAVQQPSPVHNVTIKKAETAVVGHHNTTNYVTSPTSSLTQDLFDALPANKANSGEDEPGQSKNSASGSAEKVVINSAKTAVVGHSNVVNNYMVDAGSSRSTPAEDSSD